MLKWNHFFVFGVLTVAACTYEPKPIPEDLILATWTVTPQTAILADGIQNANLTLALSDLDHQPLSKQSICFAASDTNAILSLNAAQTALTEGFEQPCQIAGMTDAQGVLEVRVTLWSDAQTTDEVTLHVDAYRIVDGKQNKLYTPGDVLFAVPRNTSALVAKFAQTTTQTNTPTALVVTLLDSNQTIYAGYRGHVALTCSQAKDSHTQNYTFVADDDGTHTFSITFESSGKQTCQVQDSNQKHWYGSDTIEITQQPHTFDASFSKGTVVIGEDVALNVTVYDANQTLLTNYQESIVMICNEPNHNITKTHQFTLNDAGRYTFSTQFLSKGTFSCTVSDTQTDPATATASIVVTEIPYTFKASFSATQAQAGTSIPLQIAVLNGNDLYTNYRGTIGIAW